MKPLSGYIYLVLAISTGIAANSFAKISDGFSKLTPTILSIAFMCITMYGLAKAMSMIPVGFTYATYSGITCLLYTSPSPRDATLSRMPSSA